MNQNYGNSKTQNLRFIIVTALVGLVILGIAIWAITFVVGNLGKKSSTASDDATKTASTSVSANSDASAMPSAISDQTEAPASTTEPSTTAPTTEGVVVVTPPTVSSVPDTGPEEFLPVALVAGTSVAYIASKRF